MFEVSQHTLCVTQAERVTKWHEPSGCESTICPSGCNRFMLLRRVARWSLTLPNTAFMNTALARPWCAGKLMMSPSHTRTPPSLPSVDSVQNFCSRASTILGDRSTARISDHPAACKCGIRHPVPVQSSARQCKPSESWCKCFGKLV